MELDGGLLPDGQRYLSEASIRERRRKKVAVGNDDIYGMGLHTSNVWGVPVVHHGGSMIGYKSDMIWLPDHGVGAVILTNAEEGWSLVDPFRRKLLEILFDGDDQATGEVSAAARNHREWLSAQRKRLQLPADAGAVAALATRYRNDALGGLDVISKGGETVFDFGEWRSEVASRRNDDGTTSFVTVVPGMGGFEFVVAEDDGQKRLVLRSSQQEYVFEAR